MSEYWETYVTDRLDLHYKKYELLILENANFDYVTASMDVFQTMIG